jgi:hypothetical protein
LLLDWPAIGEARGFGDVLQNGWGVFEGGFVAEAEHVQPRARR